MGVLGEMFPGRKLQSEAGEPGSGQRWRLGPIDLDRGVVELVPVDPEPERAEERPRRPSSPARTRSR